MTGTLTSDRAAGSAEGHRSVGRPRPGSRRTGRWPRRILALVAVAVVAGGAVAAVVLAPATAVDRVDVVVAGADDPELAAAVREVAAVRPGDPWLLVDPGAVRERVVRRVDPASVRVRREWPGLVTIDVAPRRTVAVLVVPGPGGVRAEVGPGEVRAEVGPGGRVRRVLPTGDDPAAPVAVDAVDAVDAPTLRVDAGFLPGGLPAPGTALPEPVRTAAVAVEQLPGSLRDLLTDARLDRNGELEFRLPAVAGRAAVRFGLPEQLPAKVAAAEAMLVGNVDLRCLEVLDVRRPDRPTIERTCEPGG